MLNTTPRSTATTSVFLAHLTAVGSKNIIRNTRISIIARKRHRTSCHAISDCEEEKNHNTVSHANPKHQRATEDLSAFHAVIRMTNTGNANRQNNSAQCFGSSNVV